jgi:uncharacterized protein (DUF2461 family)
LSFLEELTDNNKREWFEANKGHYESLGREPDLDSLLRDAMDVPNWAGCFCRYEANRTYVDVYPHFLWISLGIATEL